MAQRRTIGSSATMASANATFNQFLGGKTFAWMTGERPDLSRNQQNNQHNRHAIVSRPPAPPKPCRAPSPSTSPILTTVQPSSPTPPSEPAAAATASSAVLPSPTPSDDRQRGESASVTEGTASLDDIPPTAATLPEILPWADTTSVQLPTRSGEGREAESTSRVEETLSSGDGLPPTNTFMADSATPYRLTPNGDRQQAEPTSSIEWAARPSYSIRSATPSTTDPAAPPRTPRPPGHPPKRPGESETTNPQKRLRVGTVGGDHLERSTPTVTTPAVSWPSLAITRAPTAHPVRAPDPSDPPFAHDPTPNGQLGTLPQSQQRRFPQQQHPRVPLTPTPSPSYNVQNFDATRPMDDNPLLVRMAEFLSSIGGHKNLGSFYAELRFSTLQTAVREGDDLFLTLHQIFCLSSIDPEAVPASIRHHPHYAGAMQYLSVLLTPNQDLRPDILKWFSDFPQRIQDFLLKNRQAMQILQAIESIMSGFRNKDALIHQCKHRGYPPLSTELRSILGIRSCHLMVLVFTSMQRQIWGDTNEQNADIHNAILDAFMHDLKLLTDSLSAPGPPSHQPDHQGTITKFMHLTHSLTMGNVGQTHRPPQIQPRPAANSSPHRQNTTLQPQVVMNGAPSIGIRGTPVNASQVAFGHHQQQGPAGQANRLHLQLNSQQPRQWSASGHSPTTPQYSPNSGPGSTVPPVYVLPSNQRGNAVGVLSPVQASFQRVPLSQRTSSNLPHSTTSTGIRAHSSIPTAVLTPNCTAMSKFYPHPMAPPLPLPVNPQPESVLHQAHLQSPLLRDPTDSITAVSCPTLYQFVGDFALGPCRLKASFLQEFMFKLERAEYNRIPLQMNPRDGHVPVLLLQTGHRRYRLRACNRPGLKELTAADWVSTETTWATNVCLRINGQPLEIQRKQHHAKDLPIDITDRLREGTNLLTVGMMQIKIDPGLLNWVYAVEIIDIKDHTQIMAEVQARVRPSSQVLIALKNRLEGKSTSPDGSDDDLVITSSQLNINLFDPISASAIFTVPVRGESCAHFECFDLETFLASRPRKQPDWPTEVDVWRCPHCRGDARPQCLVVDGFMVAVRSRLEEIGKLNTRAITVKADGTWVPVEESHEKKDTLLQDVKRENALMEALVPRQSEIIDLSD